MITRENGIHTNYKRQLHQLLYIVCSLLLLACQASNPPKLSSGHIKPSTANKPSTIPTAITIAPNVPLPKPETKQETYTVVVNNVSVKELLYSLARDAKLNVDIHPQVTGKVTLNAYNQTLAKILDRINKQIDLRYELKDSTLIITPDKPYWQSYRIDYVNMNRKSSSEVSVATHIATTGGSVSQNANASSGGDGNISKTKVTNTSNNDFWKTMVENLKNIIADSNPNSSTESLSKVIANPTSGIVSVQATQKQHRLIQSFIEKVMTNAQRQVLIEMTIVEVELSDRFQSGIDWQRLSNSSGTGSNGLSIASKLIGANLNTAPVFTFGYNKTSAGNSNISATLKLLEGFGDVKVLSSPKLLTLNNQTALLKVVDEKVYFTVEMEVIPATDNSPESRTFTSEIHTVPVGLVMSVVPQINKDGYVSLNIRPTISRITGYANDPAPALMNQNFTNLIPEIQIRELESLLQVADGQTIVMGGLMQNRIDKKSKKIPGIKKYRKLNRLLSYRDHNFTKTELVIFLRPKIIHDARMSNTVKRHSQYLPGSINSIFKKQPPAAGKE